jgi:hypothetical protein
MTRWPPSAIFTASRWRFTPSAQRSVSPSAPTEAPATRAALSGVGDHACAPVGMVADHWPATRASGAPRCAAARAAPSSG